MWSNESFNKKAAGYIDTNASVKGKPNLTAHSFRQWVNDVSLPNETFEPGFPRKIGVETARKWMHEMGYEVLTSKTGAYVDGHKGDDVVLYPKHFCYGWSLLDFLIQQTLLQMMLSSGFLATFIAHQNQCWKNCHIFP